MATLLCPILVGRDDLLALAERRLSAARTGTGHLLFLAGEAGIGKTRLLGSALRRAARDGFATVAAAAFSRDTELAGGLLLDLAANLRGSTVAPHREVGARVTARLLETAEQARGDEHRRRRMTVLDVTEALASLAGAGPVLLALEDLHWADDLSLEVVGQLGRRLADRPMMVVGTYRSDELYPRIPMREWRARLLNQRLAEEARLSRLSLAETTTMVRAILSDEAVGAQLANAIHARSDGIPLHIEEFLAASSHSDDPGERTGSGLPRTLSDAVVARVERLGERARATASAAAVIGRSFHFDLLVEVAAEPAAEVAQSLAELDERSFVQPGAEPANYDFRHALIRDALYDQVPLPMRRELHARVVRAAPAYGLPDAVVSVHCEAANLREEAYRHSRSAAAAAAAMSSHREAFELLRRAQRCEARSTAPLARAELLAALAAEATAVDENAIAADAYEGAYGLYRSAGETVRAASLVAGWTAVRHLLGDDLPERVARLSAGLDLLTTVDDPAAGPARISLLAGLSAAHMLDRRLDESIDYGERALALGCTTQEDAELNTAATLGSVLVFAGRGDDGWPMLESAVTRARRQQHEAEAARAYRMIGTCASVLVEYGQAERWLAEGIEYAERVELDNHRHYMAAHLGHVRWATGDWGGAQRLAQAALADGRDGLTTRITALHVLGYLALGRGDWDRARRHLDEAREHGEQMAELQRLSPALWGLAEAALLTSDVEDAIAWCERGLASSQAVDDAAYLYPYLVTGARAFLRGSDPGAAGDWVDRAGALVRRRSIPGTLPAVAHARGLVELASGRTRIAYGLLSEASAGWDARRRYWEGAFCRLDLARCLQRSRRGPQAAGLVAAVRSRAVELGAAPVLAAADAVGAAADGLPPWHPLSAREYEVARLVGDGLTNREIAAKLVLAPKTVSAHVEHILSKLAVSRRAEIAAWVATVRGREGQNSP